MMKIALIGGPADGEAREVNTDGSGTPPPVLLIARRGRPRRGATGKPWYRYALRTDPDRWEDGSPYYEYHFNPDA
ncbi:hypothetical protein [Pantoea sp. BAV 3049]|uniref:hypothetical protein n=1 Tax=Pantoea sp. BAV 3049 TaxID=2654188 RepID=UPI00131B8953|nr:hypothetical protein [Pantoea sp. BAV 3049]